MSPFRRTLRQLLADRLAVVAAALLALIVALCAAAPWISGDAETLRPWIGALPPGSTTPDWPVDGSIAPGAQLAIPSDVTRLRIRLRAPATEHRAVVRQGRVDLRLGATPVHELPLAGLLIERNGETIAAPATVLRHGEPPPAAVFPPGVRVALLRDQPPELEPIVLALRDGLVQSAETADGVAVRDVRVSGDRVLALHAANADGRERLLTRFHPLGTDAMGRDLWARLLHGGQLSLMVAVVASLVSLAIGVAWGATAGFLGGRADRALMGTVDVLYALPFLFLVILLLVLFGRNLVVLFAALGVVQWLTTARIVRASVLSLATREFVAAARAGGLSEARILGAAHPAALRRSDAGRADADRAARDAGRILPRLHRPDGSVRWPQPRFLGRAGEERPRPPRQRWRPQLAADRAGDGDGGDVDVPGLARRRAARRLRSQARRRRHARVNSTGGASPSSGSVTPLPVQAISQAYSLTSGTSTAAHASPPSGVSGRSR